MANKKKQLAPGQMAKGQVVIDGIHVNDDWARKLKARKLIREGNQDENETSPEAQFAMNFAGHPNLEEMNEAERSAWMDKAYRTCLDAVDPD